MQYRVIKAHRSEFPQPITFAKGAVLEVGEVYQGDDGWDNWYFCTTPGQQGGWVPAQVIERLGEQAGRAREDYTARELDVDIGDELLCVRSLNGWSWCTRSRDAQAGWVPSSHLRHIEQAPAAQTR